MHVIGHAFSNRWIPIRAFRYPFYAQFLRALYAVDPSLARLSSGLGLQTAEINWEDDGFGNEVPPSSPSARAFIEKIAVRFGWMLYKLRMRAIAVRGVVSGQRQRRWATLRITPYLFATVP